MGGKVCGWKFHDVQANHENNENLHPTKITRNMVVSFIINCYTHVYIHTIRVTFILVCACALVCVCGGGGV